MGYCCCKYWHSPKTHDKALAVVITYDIYLEVAKGDVLPVCKLEDYMSFWEFRERLSEQQCGYRPVNKLYPGDENMRVCVQQHKVRREKRGRPKSDDDKHEITTEKLKRARHTKYRPGRLCGDLELFQKHIASKQNWKNAKPCEVCGLDTYTTCGLCKAPVHYFPQKGSQKGQSCFIDYHNDNFFGLARKDVALIGKKKKDWKAPTANVRKLNRRKIKGIMGDDEQDD